MKKIIFTSVLLLAFELVSFAQKPQNPQKYSNTITASDLSKHLSILASDEYEGRETGKEGQKKAAAYIAKEFDRIGLAAIGSDGFYQPIELTKKVLSKRNLEINQQKFEFGTNFYCSKIKSRIDFQSNEILFIGYGIVDENRNDLKNTSIKGKVVVVLAGEPTSSKIKSKLSTRELKAAKIAALQLLEPEAILFIEDGYEKRAAFYKRSMESSNLSLTYKLKPEEETKSSVITVGDEIANELLKPNKKTLAKLKKQCNSNKSGTKPLLLKSTTKASIFFIEEKIMSENVIGVLPGTDLKGDFIFITAHYDHIGVIDGKVYNGADDDGSGTVSLLEIAEAFANATKDGNGPRRSIVFMTVTGEEKGLLGSEYYTDHPIIPLKQTICDLNIDMVGRIDKKHEKDSNYVYVIGADKLSSELSGINETANSLSSNLTLDYTYNEPNDPNQFYYRSDHYNFAKNNIPIIFYFNGVHEDYHQATDEVSKISFGLMQKRAALVFHTAWELANRQMPIYVDKKNTFENK